ASQELHLDNVQRLQEAILAIEIVTKKLERTLFEFASTMDDEALCQGEEAEEFDTYSIKGDTTLSGAFHFAVILQAKLRASLLLHYSHNIVLLNALSLGMLTFSRVEASVVSIKRGTSQGWGQYRATRAVACVTERASKNRQDQELGQEAYTIKLVHRLIKDKSYFKLRKEERTSASQELHLDNVQRLQEAILAIEIVTNKLERTLFEFASTMDDEALCQGEEAEEFDTYSIKVDTTLSGAFHFAVILQAKLRASLLL
ncbi:hypothetical protein OSTOST_02330, partial [Ostertagia ostertagi]